MAWAFVNKFAVDEILNLYVSLKPQIIDPKRNLEFLHAISTFTKASVGSAAVTTYYEVRQALGGFGYSYYSELHEMINNGDINTTWEGDNRVLLQQTARFLMKNCNRVATGKEVSTEHLGYFKAFNEDKAGMLAKVADIDFNAEDLGLSQVIQVYQYFAAKTAFRGMDHFTEALGAGKDMFEVYL